MNHSIVILIDAFINIVLGILLLIFPTSLVEILGIPQTEMTFYPSILGAVLFGIGIALLIEWRRQPSGLSGLGLGGAMTINLCGGIVLAGWLLFGGLDIPVRGRVFLWSLVVLLVGISGVEVAVGRGRTRPSRD